MTPPYLTGVKFSITAGTVETVHYIVDAMNVIGSRPDGWWSDRDGAIRALVQRLARWSVTTGHRVTVVLEKPPATPVESDVITIASAPRAAPNSADDEIVRLVGIDDAPDDCTVVTSDGALAARVAALGAAVTGAGRFRDELDRAVGSA